MMLLLRLPRRAAATACAAASELALQPPAPAPQLRSAQVASGGQQLQLQWADGRRSSLHTLWLRHNCPCSHCLQPHSGQKRLRPAQLAHAGPLAAAQLDAASQTLRLQWRGDGHTAWLPLRLLQSQLPPPRGCPQLDTRTGGSQGSCAHTVGRLAPTPHEYGALVESEAALYGWLRDMALHGAALVKNAPLHPAVCRHLANRISQPMPTIYGMDFDVEATETPINIAYSTDGLDVHQDLAYYESAPGLQFLHCLAFDDQVEGGLSTMMDGFALAQRFRQQFPEDFEALSTIPATFQKIHFERQRPAYMIAQKPIVRVNQHGCIVDVVWAPPFEGPVATDSPEDMERFYRAYTRFAGMLEESTDLLDTVRLQPGDVLTFNNRRMLHGRTPFRLKPGTRRHLKGIYVNIDEFNSRLHALARTLGEDTSDIPRHIGNGQ